MIRKLFCAFIILTGLVLASAYTPKEEEECTAPHEEYSCQSSTEECHRLCKYKDYKGICFFDCWPACVCKFGYYRLGDNDRSECVLENDCPHYHEFSFKSVQSMNG